MNRCLLSNENHLDHRMSYIKVFTTIFIRYYNDIYSSVFPSSRNHKEIGEQGRIDDHRRRIRTGNDQRWTTKPSRSLSLRLWTIETTMSTCLVTLRDAFTHYKSCRTFSLFELNQFGVPTHYLSYNDNNKSVNLAGDVNILDKV